MFPLPRKAILLSFLPKQESSLRCVEPPYFSFSLPGAAILFPFPLRAGILGKTLFLPFSWRERAALWHSCGSRHPDSYSRSPSIGFCLFRGSSNYPFRTNFPRIRRLHLPKNCICQKACLSCQGPPLPVRLGVGKRFSRFGAGQYQRFGRLSGPVRRGWRRPMDIRSYGAGSGSVLPRPIAPLRLAEYWT